MSRCVYIRAAPHWRKAAEHHITTMSTDRTDAAKPEPKAEEPAPPKTPPKEVGGPKGPEPTRYGDWEQKGRCTDF